MLMFSRPPHTDNKRPTGVTEEQFQKNPTLGKIEIAKFGNVFKYYDRKFLTTYTRGYPREPFGYSFSKTPPNDEVMYIDEIYTLYQTNGLDTGTIISRGRQIPREEVEPVPCHFGDYYGDDGCEAFYYSPPSTASTTELEKATGSLQKK
jgi:hypothetical protein